VLSALALLTTAAAVRLRALWLRIAVAFARLTEMLLKSAATTPLTVHEAPKPAYQSGVIQLSFDV